MPSVESVRRNDDGSWWTRIQWYRDGVRQPPVTLRAGSAAALEQEIEAELGRLTHEIHLQRKLRGGGDPEAVGEVMTGDDLVRKWIEGHVGVELTGSTPREYAKDAAKWFCPFWGERTLSQVGRADGIEWRKWLRDEIVKSANSRLGDYEQAGIPRVNRLLTMGRSIFTFAVENGWMAKGRHPLRRVKPIPYLPPPENDDFLFEPELAEAIRLVIAEIAPQHRADPVLQMEARMAISCLAYLGTTQQDLFDARFKQALNHDGSPRDYFGIPRRVTGSGRKSANREREIEIPPQLQEEFVALWEARGRPSLDELIVPNRNGESYTRQNWQRDFWRPAIAAVKKLAVETVLMKQEVVKLEQRRLDPQPVAAPVPRFHNIPAGDGIGPHSARRCAVRMWAVAGWLDVDVLDAIGHSAGNTTTLHRFYAKAKKETRKRLTFTPVEEQIDAARAVYWSASALVERDRVLATPRAEAEAKAARQRAGRAAHRLPDVLFDDDRSAA